MKKSLLAVGCAGLLLLGSAASVWAVPIDAVPNPRTNHGGWVTDMADLLSPSTETQLENRIADLEAKNGSEIAVVTVPNTQPSASPKAFATELFNHWKIGKADKNNGVLLLISKDDRRVEIEVGRGLSTVLPNMNVTHLLNTKIKPQFQQGQFDAGTLAGTQAIAEILEKEIEPTSDNSSPAFQTIGLRIGGAIVGILFFYGLAQAISHFVLWIANRRDRQPQPRPAPSTASPVLPTTPATPQTRSKKSSKKQARKAAAKQERLRRSNASSDRYSDSSSWDASDSSSTWNSSDSSSWTSYDSSSSWSSSDSSSSSDFGGGSSDGGGSGCDW